MHPSAERKPATTVEALKVPPHSIEAEQAVLGGLMLATEAWERIADRINEDDFYRRDHRLIFRAIQTLSEKDQPCDAITLGEWFAAQNLGDQVGGMAYVIELANSTPSAANIVAYAGDAYQPEGRGSQELLETAEQKVFRIAESGSRGRKGFVPARAAAKEAFQILASRYENRGQITGMPTGYTDLDEMTTGLQPSDLIIIAARPSMGKTALALNMAENAAMRTKKAVAVFSMEMSSSRVTSAITQLSDTRIFIDDTPALSPGELRARARRLKREHDLGLIVIDYLQLMQVPGNKENRATEISEISRGLKALAKELNVPIIALSQLNRSLEQRTDKKPLMSDLRESGAIEQDADVVMFIYRDDYYNQDSPDKGVAEIIVSKQRNGPIGTVRLAFLGQFTRFENLAPDRYTDQFE